jgi:hypothetical protein
LGYKIFIRESDGTTYTQVDDSVCDGTDADVISNTQCTVPISYVRAAPYSLPWGSNVYAKVVGYNTYGDSAMSPAGSEAIILTIPDTPISIAEVEVARSASSITLNWA